MSILTYNKNKNKYIMLKLICQNKHNGGSMINTLSYGLLSLLTQKPCTGYDLMGKINLFWPAGHGQIYPLLAKLEQDGLITFERVEQTEKPDKKVYTLTDKGGDALKMWLTSPTAE